MNMNSEVNNPFSARLKKCTQLYLHKLKAVEEVTCKKQQYQK